MSASQIVVGYDGSRDAREALRWAFAEAARTGADVDIVYVWRWPEYLPASSLVPGVPVWPDMTAEKELEVMLADVADGARAQFPGVTARTVIAHGSPASVLRDLSSGASLVVVGGRSHGLLQDFWLGSVAGALAAHASSSVVVVRDGGDKPAGAPIVLGLDESGHSDRAAEFAFEQAAAQNVPLRVVRAWMPPPDPWLGSSFIDREEVSTAELAAVREQVGVWQRKYPSVELRIEAIVGHPYRVVAEAAEQARMVVLGARGKGGFSALRLGSVSRYVLHHVSVTTAIVR
ncbi:universal stress protein [Paractinoplanes hotanensis]|uniref:Universal stress protein n=1 Tax=Paractinoplanes hotanensis TaxID=2906497 RepID=A0ABT0YF64_9ACTN|nr:universal stress protein [Actinoplanes hotanensis]MCM4084380.1 universal stress protein [Actinoplanes hotanensis]